MTTTFAQVKNNTHARLASLADEFNHVEGLRARAEEHAAATDLELEDLQASTAQAEPIPVFMDSLTRQRFMYNLGGSIILEDERSAYYFHRAVMLCLAIPTVDNLFKTKWGPERYSRFRAELISYSQILGKLKYHLDHMHKKTLTDGDIESTAYKNCMRWLTELPLVWQELDMAFSLICKYTTLGQNTVMTQALSVFTKLYKDVKYDEPRAQRGSEYTEGAPQ